jgi:hypothetical protein
VSAVAPATRQETPAQLAAARKNLVKARAVLKSRHSRSPAQVAASRRNLAIARAAQKARASGKTPAAAKTPVAAKKATAALLRDDQGLHGLPACAAVAAAEHLAAYTGILVPDQAVLDLHNRVQPASIAVLLEYLRAEGFPGSEEKLAYYERCDPDSGTPGLIYGVQLGRGYHAVMSYPGAMASWGMLLARAGTPEEAWWLEWEAE